MISGIPFDQIRAGTATHDLISLYEDTTEDNDYNDSPFQYSHIKCDYFEPEEFSDVHQHMHSTLSYFHINCRGLLSNWDSFYDLMCQLNNDSFLFDCIGISENYRTLSDARLSLNGYHDIITRCRDDGPRGGVGLFLKDNINFKIRDDISVFIPHVFESLFVEIIPQSGKNTILGVVYRPNSAPRADMDIFSSTLFDIMDTVNKEHKHCVIMGDMNIDLLKFETHLKTSDYLDNLFQNGFLPTITKPTRITSTSATLIDHIYTNNITTTGTSGIIITDLADHFGTFYISQTEKTKQSKESTNKTRIFSDANIVKFKEYLELMNFTDVLATLCPNEAYSKFIKLYKHAFETCFPVRTCKINNKVFKREPWITTGILTSSKQKAKLFAKKLHKPTADNIAAYKEYNSMFNRLKRAIKIKYFQNALEENKRNIRKTWSILRKAMGKLNNKTSFPQTFLINEASITDKSQIAEGFNNYFSKIGIQTNHSVPQSTKHFTEYMPRPNIHSMFLEPVAPSDVISATQQLKPKLSQGYDGISTKLLKETISYILQPITHIINRSFDTGIVPQDLKIAKVIPIYKSSDQSLLKNYRPVSLLPAISKIVEKIMYKKLLSFLEPILFKHQYGFRPKHSTIHPIIHLLNYCAESSNKPTSEITLAIFCDLSKAFDVISHEILLNKLNNYGIRGNVNNWFRSYLTNRSQFVDIDGHSSSLLNIQCGVPQGSILGPLLYLIYVNDIPNSCNGNILSFADDTTLYMSNSNLPALFLEANQTVNKLFNWFCANRLSLNPTKTKYIVIRPYQQQCNFTGLNVAINNNILKRIGNDCEEKSVKFLGIFIDENLSWKYHIAHVNKRISGALFSIKQVKNMLPKDCLRALYFALVHSHICYGILAWGNCNEKTLHRTVLLQKRAIRIINNAKFKSHTDPLFKATNIMKITDQYIFQSTLFVFDFITKYLPYSFEQMFRFNHDIPNSRATRQSDLLYEARCKTNFANSLPLYAMPKIWNKWFHAMPQNMSRPKFKYTMKIKILSAYQSHVTCTNSFCPDCFPQAVQA